MLLLLLTRLHRLQTIMLVLFETPAGYALFKLLDKGKLKTPDDLHRDFETPEKAAEM